MPWQFVRHDFHGRRTTSARFSRSPRLRRAMPALRSRSPNSMAATARAFLKASLTADARDNLFGTTETGGSTPTIGSRPARCSKSSRRHGYSGTPTTLASFYDQSDGLSPEGGLIMDANGDLFGPPAAGRIPSTQTRFLPANDGDVFEIERTARGLREHAHHRGDVQLLGRFDARCRPYCRRRRQPVRHNLGRRPISTRVRRRQHRHGVRDHEQRLCDHRDAHDQRQHRMAQRLDGRRRTLEPERLGRFHLREPELRSEVSGAVAVSVTDMLAWNSMSACGCHDEGGRVFGEMLAISRAIVILV